MYRNTLKEVLPVALFILRSERKEICLLDLVEPSVLLWVQRTIGSISLQRHREVLALAGIPRRIDRLIPQGARLLLKHTGNENLLVSHHATNTTYHCAGIPLILEDLTGDLVKPITQEAVNDKTRSAWQPARRGKITTQGFDVSTNHRQVKPILPLRITVFDKPRHFTSNVSIMRMVVVVELSALNQTTAFTKLMTQRRFDGNDLRPRILLLTQLTNKLHYLTRLNKLPVDESLHHPLSYVGASQILQLLVGNEPRAIERRPPCPLCTNNPRIEQQRIELALILLFANQRLVVEAVVFHIALRNDVIHFIGMKLIDVKRFARIERLAALHEIEHELLIIKFVFRRLQVGKNIFVELHSIVF